MNAHKFDFVGDLLIAHRIIDAQRERNKDAKTCADAVPDTELEEAAWQYLFAAADFVNNDALADGIIEGKIVRLWLK